MYSFVKKAIFVLSVCIGLMFLYYFGPESGWLSLVWPPSITTGLLISLIFLAVGAIILQGLKNIPANPPHRAIITRLGKRTTKVKKEGWRLFIFYPYLYGYILVNMTKVNFDLPPQIVRTPDMGELEIPISLTWTPLDAVVESCESCEPGPKVNGLVNYLNSGGENGVKEILSDIVRERLREWAMSKVEGPKTWEQALGAREEAVDVLMKSIARGSIDSLNSDIPTSILLRFFNFSRNEFTYKGKTVDEESKNAETPAPDADGEEKNGEADEQRDWALLKKLYQPLSVEKRTELKKAVVDRKKKIAKLRQGNGGIQLPQLGIRLDRLNIDEIKAKGKLAESAEKMVMEKRDAKGDKIRIDNISARIKELEKLGFGPEQALEIVQTERGKVTKSISETKFNLSAETRAMIEKIAPEIINGILAKR